LSKQKVGVDKQSSVLLGEIAKKWLDSTSWFYR